MAYVTGNFYKQQTMAIEIIEGEGSKEEAPKENNGKGLNLEEGTGGAESTPKKKPAAKKKPVIKETKAELLEQNEELQEKIADLEKNAAKPVSTEDEAPAFNIAEEVKRQVALAMSNISTEDHSEAMSDAEALMKSAVDDTLEFPVHFFAHNYKYCTFGYTLNGKAIRPPGEEQKIPFTPYQRYKKASGNRNRGVVVVSISRFVTRSKEMVEFIKNSPKFGTMVFLTPKNVKESEVHLVDAMQMYSNKVRAMSDTKIREESISAGLQVHPNPSLMRKNLITHLATVAVAEDDLRKRKVLEKHNADKKRVEELM